MDFQSRDRRTFILLTIVLVGHSLRTQAEAVGNHQFVDCFNQYTSSQNDIAERYKNSHMICRMEHAGNESLLRPPRVPSIDLDVEMANFARTSNEICWGLKACDLIQDPSMFFKCYSKAAAESMQKSLDIHFNASYIVVELSDVLTENEKAAIQCTMIAKQSFINESLNSFRHFLKCWDN